MKTLLKIVVRSQLIFWVLFLSGCNSDYLHISFFEMQSGMVEYDESNAAYYLPVAAVCMEISQKPAENLTKMLKFIDTITTDQPDTRLILFGESSMGWYQIDNQAEYQDTIAEEIDGPFMQQIKQAAIANNIYIAYGYTQRLGSAIYNAFALIDPEGRLIANHHKILMTQPDIDSGYQVGSGPTTAMVDNTKVGMYICRDINSVSLTKAFAQDSEIKILLMPMAYSGIAYNKSFTRNRLHNKWLLVADRVGVEGSTTYPGEYGVFDPTGFPKNTDKGREGYLYYSIGIQ